MRNDKMSLKTQSSSACTEVNFIQESICIADCFQVGKRNIIKDVAQTEGHSVTETTDTRKRKNCGSELFNIIGFGEFQRNQYCL